MKLPQSTHATAPVPPGRDSARASFQQAGLPTLGGRTPLDAATLVLLRPG